MLDPSLLAARSFIPITDKMVAAACKFRRKLPFGEDNMGAGGEFPLIIILYTTYGLAVADISTQYSSTPGFSSITLNRT